MAGRGGASQPQDESTVRLNFDARNPYVGRATRKLIAAKLLYDTKLRFRSFCQSMCSQARPQLKREYPDEAEVQVAHGLWTTAPAAEGTNGVTRFLQKMHLRECRAKKRAQSRGFESQEARADVHRVVFPEDERRSVDASGALVLEGDEASPRDAVTERPEVCDPGVPVVTEQPGLDGRRCLGGGGICRVVEIVKVRDRVLGEVVAPCLKRG